MAEEFIYHYTSKEAARSIIFQGKILPSLGDNGDAIHGDGVYLTTLEPGQGEESIKNNNWDGMAATKTNIEVFFEILIPSRKVVRANDTRNILVHEGPLRLSDYKWSLKNWDGQLLATQFFMVTTEGKAKEHQLSCMGRYTLVRDVLTRQDGECIHVYKKDEKTMYLYNCDGDWCVGEIVGDEMCQLIQWNDDNERYEYSPSKTKPWSYWADGGWKEDDKFLRVYPCYF